MMSNEQREYEDLCERVRNAQDVPEGLAFWLEHAPHRSGHLVWRECPRADWLLWIAELYGARVTLARQIVQNETEARRTAAVAASPQKLGRDPGVFTPTTDAADRTRQLIQWGDLADLVERKARRTGARRAA